MPTTAPSTGAPCILQGTVQFPSAQKSKQKDLWASVSDSKHIAMANTKCGFTMLKKIYIYINRRNQLITLLGQQLPMQRTESCGCTNNSKGCTASPELGAQ